MSSSAHTHSPTHSICCQARVNCKVEEEWSLLFFFLETHTFKHCHAHTPAHPIRDRDTHTNTWADSLVCFLILRPMTKSKTPYEHTHIRIIHNYISLPAVSLNPADVGLVWCAGLWPNWFVCMSLTANTSMYTQTCGR